MRKGFFHDGAGNRSMNRLLAFMGGWLGVLIAVAGVVALFRIDDKGSAIAAIGIGSALFGGGEWLKNRGKELENGRSSAAQ